MGCGASASKPPDNAKEAAALPEKQPSHGKAQQLTNSCGSERTRNGSVSWEAGDVHIPSIGNRPGTPTPLAAAAAAAEEISSATGAFPHNIFLKRVTSKGIEVTERLIPGDEFTELSASSPAKSPEGPQGARERRESQRMRPRMNSVSESSELDEKGFDLLSQAADHAEQPEALEAQISDQTQ